MDVNKGRCVAVGFHTPQRGGRSPVAGSVGLRALVLIGLLLFVPFPAAAQSLFGSSLANMLERITPAVVNISTVTQLAKPRSPLANDPVLGPLIPGSHRFDTTRSGGSGVIINAERGIVVTNHHVIERAREIRVILRDRREFEAELIGADPAVDIAVLRIAPENLSGY